MGRDAMKKINFCTAEGGPYSGILDSLIDPIQHHLPESKRLNRVIPGAINVTFFVGSKRRQVFIPHGIADKNYRNANKLKLFNYVVVSGYAWVNRLVNQGFPLSRIFVGGYTKLDPLFQGKYKKTSRTKPLILYAPTHGAVQEVSLHGRFEKEIGKLRRYYRVFKAPHPTQNVDGSVTMKALLDADVVISDAGSLLYEAWALDKPVVFPSWLLKKGVLNRFPGSFEDQIYREEIGYHAWDSTNLLDCVKQAYLNGIDDRAKDFIEGIFPQSLRGCSGWETANFLRRIANE